MNQRWAPAFTIVELLIVVVVIAILASISVVAYNGITDRVLASAASSDLRNTAIAMQQAYQVTNTYPSTLPTHIKPSENIHIRLGYAYSLPHYVGLSPVQHGMLFARICQQLIDEGAGKAADQGGTLQSYIIGCGNWNHGSVQITGWASPVWVTPVAKQALLNYAAQYGAADSWHPHEREAVQAFYTQLVERYEQQGGAFPITSFWDAWATDSNGGVMQQPLDNHPPIQSSFCVEAQARSRPELTWNVTEAGKITTGGCSS